MKRIKIFLASSVVDFSYERNALKSFAGKINVALSDFGVCVRTFICEYADNAIARSGKQNEYNLEIEDSDIFLLLAGERVGQYTIEEYDNAVKTRLANEKPYIVAAFKNVPDQDETIRAFKDRIVADKVFSFEFDSLSRVKRVLAEKIAFLVSDVAALTVTEDAVTVAGKIIARF
jgi:hypothetical protein